MGSRTWHRPWSLEPNSLPCFDDHTPNPNHHLQSNSKLSVENISLYTKQTCSETLLLTLITTYNPTPNSPWNISPFYIKQTLKREKERSNICNLFYPFFIHIKYGWVMYFIHFHLNHFLYVHIWLNHPICHPYRQLSTTKNQYTELFVNLVLVTTCKQCKMS